MITLDIPGRGTLALEYLVLDVNGTISLDGNLLPGVAERVGVLRQKLKVYLLTADTFGRARDLAGELEVSMQRIAHPGEREAKEAFVRSLGVDRVVAVGNGANDVAMLRCVALSIAVLGPECTSAEAVQTADVVAPDIAAALDLLIHTKRLVATLRR